ncbi:myc-regulated DEAD/H box 18 RNA helicase-like (ISS) [Planoprotostelium fungivorum]|uniref:ATP-dependent RNA helicase n=1 Tax=Planoprotostelium fungivorum TaxID=1890364 RepID=A0A2P6N6Y6_9EUKA|nr:myc-regulated DEAD/H box 18 RNA helicase-like (ISS) [Planoprotostelium fungivorum]
MAHEAWVLMEISQTQYTSVVFLLRAIEFIIYRGGSVTPRRPSRGLFIRIWDGDTVYRLIPGMATCDDLSGVGKELHGYVTVSNCCQREHKKHPEGSKRNSKKEVESDGDQEIQEVQPIKRRHASPSPGRRPHITPPKPRHKRKTKNEDRRNATEGSSMNNEGEEMDVEPTASEESASMMDEDGQQKEITQYCITSSFHDQYALLHSLITIEKALATNERPFKAIVFLSSVQATRVIHQALSTIRSAPFNQIEIFQLHIKVDKAARTSTLQEFKKIREGILVSSDATIRCEDYTNITHVFQIGVPNTVKQYYSRVNVLTKGSSFILLDQLETDFLEESDFPFTVYERTGEIAQTFQQSKQIFNRAIVAIHWTQRKKMYTAWMAEKRGLGKKMGWPEFIQLAFDYSKSTLLFREPPAINSTFIQKIGLQQYKSFFTIHDDK